LAPPAPHGIRADVGHVAAHAAKFENNGLLGDAGTASQDPVLAQTSHLSQHFLLMN